MKFNEQLRIARERKNLSQTELAEKLLVSKTTIEAFENGSAEPDTSTLVSLSKALSVSTDYLCANDDSTSFLNQKNSVVSKAVRGVIIAVIAVVIFFGGFTIGSSFKATVNSFKEQVPDKVSASGVSFSFDGENVKYRFSPSVTGKNYSYKICFIDYLGKEFVFDTEQKGGVCSGSVVFDSINIQCVTYSVTNLKQTRTAMIATNLDLNVSGTTWQEI